MRRRLWWVIIVAVVVGAPVAWYLASPLFISRAVSEEFPMSAGAAAAALVRGTFTGADSFHRGRGTATFYRVGEELVLRFEEFQVTNGPDLHVILTTEAAPKTRTDVQRGYIEVAKLKGNIGDQNYTLSAGINLGDYRAVVIYCKPFHVVFATAPLSAAQ